MWRAVLTVALLALTAQAAPQLKPRPPATGSEEARIEALRARYDRLRRGEPTAADIDPAWRSTQPAMVQTLVEIAASRLDRVLAELDAAATGPRPPDWGQIEQGMRRLLDADPHLRALYDIALYDRWKAAGE